LTAAVLMLGLCVSVSLSQSISGSEHDFSGETWNSSGQICIVCHTPHNAQAVTDAPLWNHTQTTQTFTPYSSSTLDATVGQPGNISKLCLSCHDGTVAIDSFGGSTGSNFVTGNALVGTDLSNDHPVGFTYDANLASTDGGLKDPTTATGITGTIANDMLFGSGNNQLECASCHNVHDNTYGNFLIKSNAGSALCLTCHNK